MKFQFVSMVAYLTYGTKQIRIFIIKHIDEANAHFWPQCHAELFICTGKFHTIQIDFLFKYGTVE